MRTDRKQKKQKRHIAANICSILGIVLLTAVILICIPLTLPRLAGYEIYNVISGSMEPAIPIGSLVYVQDMAPAKVQKGDVIAFGSSLNDGAVITHRVVLNNSVVGEFVTKGDANAKEDMEPVKYENFTGKVALTIPVLGGVFAAIVTIQGKIAVGSMIVLSLVLHLIAGKIKK